MACVSLRVATLAVATIAFPAISPSASIVLMSSANGVYDYALQVVNESITFNRGQAIILSGLTGVSAASSTGLLAQDFPFVSIMGSTVSFFVSPFFQTVTFNGGPPQPQFPFPFTGLEIQSSAGSVGEIQFALDTSTGTITGTTLGPVATAPEGSSFLLLLVGFGAWVFLRRNATKFDGGPHLSQARVASMQKQTGPQR